MMEESFGTSKRRKGFKKRYVAEWYGASASALTPKSGLLGTFGASEPLDDD
jgi:hypothetical protein